MTLTKIQVGLMEMRRQGTKFKMAAMLESKGLAPIVETEEQLIARQIASSFGSACVPNCPHCGGTGFVRWDVPVGHEKFGKVEPCERYRASRVRDIDPLEFGLERDELDLDWSDVKKRIGNVQLEGIKAVEAVKPAFERGHGMIALLGKVGNAKTLTGKILIAKSILAGKRAAYANLNRILNTIRLAFDEKENMTRELLRRLDYWMSLDVIFIDELDKVNETEWARSVMFELLDRRYVRAVREEALTVIASNKKDDELDAYLVSRLKDHRLGPVLILDGEDARALMPDGYRH